MEKFYYNEEMYEWERVDKTQAYKGYTIETLTTHGDYYFAPNHRTYRITNPDGRVWYMGINKRGGNIKSLKDHIDRKVKYPTR